MYHEAPRDTGEKKRHRLTPPPNEMWMEAIMSKGKPPSGYISCSMTSTNAATSPTTLGWQDRVRMTSQVSMGQEGTLPYQQFATGYAGRLNMEPSAPLYQGRAIGNCPETGQGRPMDSAVPYYERMGSGSGYPSKSDGFQDTQVDKSTSSYQRKMIEAPPAGYHKKTIDGGGASVRKDVK
ncbi:hypothetical protein PsorP6_003398 [Peronosclerospora sorghi]|uniref:Uncharacterized protein n=1 Tax=Peronosclerospora sorghi TaxID=230839 RepID=A0ACC0VRD1_9STRA|nr:hypothetical protein PsorP6_003398 [Peronosclerospora sorghi]